MEKPSKKKLQFYWRLTRGVAREKLNLGYYHDGIIRHFSKNTLDEFVVVDYGKIRYVVIGGSSKDKGEWHSNFDGYKTVNGVHKSFLHYGREILKDIRDFLVEDGYKIVVIGHSRGGALAQILGYLGYTDLVVTFGSPRAFTKHKCTQLHFKHLLVRSKGDGVTRLPCAWMPPIWKRYFTSEIVFPAIRGSDHTSYGKQIERFYS